MKKTLLLAVMFVGVASMTSCKKDRDCECTISGQTTVTTITDQSKSDAEEAGDELLLYFLEKGDTCVMTMTCCMGQTKSEIRAVAEKDSKLLMIPVSKMADWIVKYPTWRNFVFESYNSRFNEMLEAIDSLAFLNMHDRILKYLKDKVMVIGETTLPITHQEIALDLHSSRVVVSRILKRLEIDGLIRLHRNKIEVLIF